MRTERNGEWRRIGVIVPSSNTTVEADFLRALPPGATLHPARMHLSHTSAEAERRMLTHHVPQAVEDVASLYPWVVAFCCTSAGAVLGAEGEARLLEEMAAKCRAHVVSTNNAVQNAIEAHAPQRVAVLTPYIDELNAAIRAGLEGRGLNVVHIAGLGITDNFGICSVTPAEIVAFAERELPKVDFDLLFVSCTNFRAVEARPALMERFGVPVVTSNQATVDATLATLTMPPAAASPQPSAVS